MSKTKTSFYIELLHILHKLYFHLHSIISHLHSVSPIYPKINYKYFPLTFLFLCFDLLAQANNPEVKKLCRPSSASRPESQGGRASTKSKASSSASQEPSYKDNLNEKLEMQKEILNNRKMNRELKNQKKELKEMNREVIASGERSLSDNKSCFETFIGICQSAEDRNDLEAAAKNEARLLKIARGRYKCSRCGALKVCYVVWRDVT